MSDEAADLKAAPTKVYRRPLAPTWFLRRRSYFLYVVRELTVVFMVAWLAWFLYQVWLLRNGEFESLNGETGVLIFSAVCLFFTLWHAITFLNLSGLIMRVPIGDHYLPATAVKAAAFGGLVFVTVAGGAIMVYLGYLSP